MRSSSYLSHVRTWPSYFSEGCAGISCHVAVQLPAVQLFAGKLDPPRDLLLFQLLGCENILVFVVSQKKNENLICTFGGVPHEFH